MKYLPANTLAYYNAAPQGHRHDLSGMPVSVFGAATKLYRKTCTEAFPNDEAISFYALNHCASIVKKLFTPNEPLPLWTEDVMRSYSMVCMEQGKRMLHYILSITTREMRHLKSSSATFWKKMNDQHGVEAASFVKAISTLGSAGEMQAVARYMDNPPDTTIGQYVAALSYGFHNGSWSSGYGGPKWGHVTDAALSMLTGKTSMEMLVDTGYTLAHNGGPIFNKGMMYTHYDGAFQCILDVQRSGQIPDLILDPQLYSVKKTDIAKKIVKLVADAQCGNWKGADEFKGWVDWELVEKLGSLGHYPEYKTKQKMLHPTTPEAKKALEKKVGGKKVKITNEWAVFPGQTVQVFERISA